MSDGGVFTCSPYLDSVQGGATALMVAAQNGHSRAVGLLIAAKAQVDMQGNVRFIAFLHVSNIISRICTEWDDSIACGQLEWSL